ncbi:Rho GTPase-activating protein 4 [Raphanus sativus]|uniref:Rho GTPase-activating protein 4 n=1 Tax=Raphanus sativus TaxID=3726 RepID=A0A6J0K1S9_RAPSA|nr:rho GTPase-activating protein 4 [Raphanus sativus]KAJ4885800.1 Rho GTPase-activating protein 4 [Raphanus sativus]
MAKVLNSSQSCRFPSPSSSSSTSCGANDGNRDPHSLFNISRQEEEEEEEERSEKEEERFELSSALEILVSAIRRSVIGGCVGEEDLCSMEIGVPSDVRHVAHVTFDRFHGFLGLPVEFEPEVPRRAPSASATVFGVSTESMQLSYDTRGNIVPTILLMMQSHLYSRGGLQVEGIFRINGENTQEEYIREELNKGVIPNNIDVHCLASLIKAWFRELPTGVLDSLSPEQVMESETEDECVELVKLLPSTEASLLDWSVNLMADVVEMEHVNKMNARNIAMVFAPNMTQMLDPLTALMYAVKVMNFLKTLIGKTLKERKEARDRLVQGSNPGPRDQNGDDQSSRQLLHLMKAANEEEAVDTFEAETKDREGSEELIGLKSSLVKSCGGFGEKENGWEEENRKMKRTMSNASSIVGRVNYRVELFEAWR